MTHPDDNARQKCLTWRPSKGDEKTFRFPFSIQQLLYHPKSGHLLAVEKDTIHFLDASPKEDRRILKGRANIGGLVHIEELYDINLAPTSLILAHFNLDGKDLKCLLWFNGEWDIRDL